MNAKVGLSSWRNIVEAIGQRFMKYPFEFDQDEKWTDEVSEWWDLMFAHSSGMGEDMYARLMTEAPGERGSQRAKYRYICQEWHQFLHFPSVSHGLVKAPASFYDEATRAMQVQRFHQIKETNIEHALARLMSDDGAQFRPGQARAIQAVMGGKSPIFIVMATSAGKSLVFMLPAFCSLGGTTIVIVPITSLQSDLKRRCDAQGIPCSIWQSGQSISPTAIVLVTPESALTKGFRGFINLLRSTHRLDRIVVDECHYIQYSRPHFRPAMGKLGELVRLGAQMIFMTATLRPSDEEGFFDQMHIVGKGVTTIRMRTTRTNIQYQIRTYPPTRAPSPAEDSSITAVKEVVQEMRIKYPAPAKIIVYSGIKQQADQLAADLGCLVYHAEVGSRAEKDRRLTRWAQGGEDDRIVVAANALGLGVDVGDTRAVIHITMPEDLASFVQESGRAGRDGERSESIVLMPGRRPEELAKWKRRVAMVGPPRPVEAITYRHKKDQPITRAQQQMEAEIREYVEGSCRRVVIDRVMDGPRDGPARIRCEEGEEACDQCEAASREAKRGQQRERILAQLEEERGEAIKREVVVGVGRPASVADWKKSRGSQK